MHISEEAANATPQLRSETKDPETVQGQVVTSEIASGEPVAMDDLICVNSGPLSDITEVPAVTGEETNDNEKANNNNNADATAPALNDNDGVGGKEDVGVLMTVPTASAAASAEEPSASVKRPVTVTTSMTSASVVMSETSSSVIGMTPTSPRSITTTSMSASGKSIITSLFDLERNICIIGFSSGAPLFVASKYETQLHVLFSIFHIS